MQVISFGLSMKKYILSQAVNEKCLRYRIVLDNAINFGTVLLLDDSVSDLFSVAEREAIE